MQVTAWSDLQAFLAIARAGQLARAAHVLGLDATTMGRRLRRLEARLGASLFEQTREGQVLTEAGERLLAQVEGMAASAAGIAESAGSAGDLAGSLRISVPEGFGSWFLSRHVAAFAAAHPRLTLDLATQIERLAFPAFERRIEPTLERVDQ